MKAKPGIESRTESRNDTNTRTGKTLDETTQKTHAQHVIDTVLATLYANDARGYLGGDEKTIRIEAIKRIERELAGLDPTTRSSLSDETKYRIERFEDFTKASRTSREDVLELAKTRHISIEQANERKKK